MLISPALLAAWGQESGAAGADKSAAIAPGTRTADDLMLLAAKENGLGGEDAAPWHLKASYAVMDESGKVTDEGIYEEFWVSSTKYKRIYVGEQFSQTDYGTDKDTMRVGSKAPVPMLLAEARREFTNPLPNPGMVGKATFELKETETSGIKLECLRSTGAPLTSDRTYCVGDDKPFARIISSASESEQILHNRILAFRGSFIAGDLQFVLAGRRRLTVHLESIESLNPVDEAIFTPPADALSVPKIVDVSSAVSTGMLLRKVAPEYPFSAKRNYITGKVVLQALIGKDGHIQDLLVVSGPRELQAASIEAVRQWLYKPYVLNGEPVAVRTTINVIFTLGRR
jgi:TonB family protein